jgi:polysaccharide export outer membrane protein
MTTTNTRFPRIALMAIFALGAGFATTAAQGPVPEAGTRPGAGTVRAADVPGYVIGPDDVLTIVFWREKDLSGDVIVRPDGKITLPLLNEIEATGLTPDELRTKLTAAAERYVQDPNVTVIVKEIRSRKVFITGQVGKPGTYPLMSPTTVLQLISMAGGLQEYAKRDKIVIMRDEAGKPVRHQFNFDWVMQGLNLRQNIELKPGDVVVVP